MTTPLVKPITNDLIEALEAIEHDASFVTREADSQEYLGMLARRVLDRLRSAEQDARRMEKALLDISKEVDGNIRATVRDCVNGCDDVQDIYAYCDHIDDIIDAAMSTPNPPE